MEPPQWTPAIAVGLPQVDDQHRELFDRAGRFFATAGGVRQEAEVAAALEYLDRYIRFHFSEEERLMESLGYPGLAAHREEHEAYARRLDGLGSQFESEGDSAALMAALDGLLRLWLLEHISRADRLLAEFAASSSRLRS